MTKKNDAAFTAYAAKFDARRLHDAETEAKAAALLTQALAAMRKVRALFDTDTNAIRERDLKYYDAEIARINRMIAYYDAKVAYALRPARPETTDVTV